MCLGELAEVLAVTGPATAVVRRDGRSTATVSLLALAEPVVAGDWLLVHSGFALHRLTPDEAQDAAAIRAGGDTMTSRAAADRQEATP